MGCLTPLTAFRYLLSHMVSGKARSLKDIMTKIIYFLTNLASTDFILEVFLGQADAGATGTCLTHKTTGEKNQS